MKKFNFFHDTQVLITGHTGFKGSWLSLILLELKANVIGISKDIPTEPSNFEVLGLQNKIEHYEQDVSNTEELSKIINNTQPDFIFHLAAQPLVRRSLEDPWETWRSNSLGTISLLEGIKRLKKDCIVVFITSDKVYKNQEWAWGYRETDLLGGDDPYSASKASAELAIKSYLNSILSYEGLKVGVGRAGNVIGGGDWGYDRIVPDCMKSWAQNKKVLIRNPNSTRPWQHVLEPLFGYLTLAKKLNENDNIHGEAFNFGPSGRSNHSVLDLVIEMSKYWDKVLWEEVASQSKVKSETNLLKLNCDKAKMFLDWETIWDFENTIKHTSNWYKLFYENKNLYDLSINQINTYLDNMKNFNI